MSVFLKTGRVLLTSSFAGKVASSFSCCCNPTIYCNVRLDCDQITSASRKCGHQSFGPDPPAWSPPGCPPPYDRRVWRTINLSASGHHNTHYPDPPSDYTVSVSGDWTETTDADPDTGRCISIVNGGTCTVTDPGGSYEIGDCLPCGCDGGYPPSWGQCSGCHVLASYVGMCGEHVATSGPTSRGVSASCSGGGGIGEPYSYDISYNCTITLSDEFTSDTVLGSCGDYFPDYDEDYDDDCVATYRLSRSDDDSIAGCYESRFKPRFTLLEDPENPHEDPIVLCYEVVFRAAGSGDPPVVLAKKTIIFAVGVTEVFGDEVMEPSEEGDSFIQNTYCNCSCAYPEAAEGDPPRTDIYIDITVSVNGSCEGTTVVTDSPGEYHDPNTLHAIGIPDWIGEICYSVEGFVVDGGSGRVITEGGETGFSPGYVAGIGWMIISGTVFGTYMDAGTYFIIIPGGGWPFCPGDGRDVEAHPITMGGETTINQTDGGVTMTTVITIS